MKDEQQDGTLERQAPSAAEPQVPTVDDGRRDMTLIDHLDELRTVLIRSAAAVLLGAIICWFFSARLLDLLIRPLTATGQLVYFHHPLEAFLTRLRIAFVCGVFIVLPYVLWQVYSFVLPGLYRNERRYATPLLVASSALFYTGVAFAFLILIPQVMVFMLSFATARMEPLIGIGPYFDFVSRLCLAFGIVFELPLLIFTLSSFGVVHPRIMLRWWRYALLIIVTMSAILTPPDVLSQILMAGPVMLLYLGSVLISLMVSKRRESPPAPSDED